MMNYENDTYVRLDYDKATGFKYFVDIALLRNKSLEKVSDSYINDMVEATSIQLTKQKKKDLRKILRGIRDGVDVDIQDPAVLYGEVWRLSTRRIFALFGRTPEGRSRLNTMFEKLSETLCEGILEKDSLQAKPGLENEYIVTMNNLKRLKEHIEFIVNGCPCLRNVYAQIKDTGENCILSIVYFPCNSILDGLTRVV